MNLKKRNHAQAIGMLLLAELSLIDVTIVGRFFLTPLAFHPLGLGFITTHPVFICIDVLKAVV